MPTTPKEVTPRPKAAPRPTTRAGRAAASAARKAAAEAHAAPSGHDVIDGPGASEVRPHPLDVLVLGQQESAVIERPSNLGEMLAVEATSTDEVAAENRVERLHLAKAEKVALDAWWAAGGAPPRPATPNLDAIHAEANHAPGAKPHVRKGRTAPGAKASRSVAPTGLRFYHDGKRINDSHNRLASLAWFYTKGVDGVEQRITPARLREILAEAGIAAPDSTEWEHKLSNGRVLAAVLEG